MPHIKPRKIWGDTMHSHTHTHTHTEKVGHSAHNHSIMRSVCPLCICQRDFEGEALLPLGSKQPPKTNNCIQEIVYMHQNTPHQKRKKEKKKSTLKYLCARYRANQYFNSPALIVHAGHEKANEAKLQRQCAHQSRLSAKGQSYLSDPRHQSGSARDERLLKWTTGDLPLDDSLWVGISVRESTDVVPSDLLLSKPSRFICRLLSAHFESHFMWETCHATKCLSGWIDTRSAAWSYEAVNQSSAHHK